MQEAKVVLYARIDPDLFALLKKEADKQCRSANKQVEYVLREYFRKVKP